MEDKVITIEKVVYGGKGLSRDLQHVTFVPYTLPGEKVRVQLRKQHRDYTEADPIEIVEPSKDRIAPDCRYFGRCGGCHLSHAHYEAQLEIKLAMLQETLQRNKIPFPQTEIVSGPPFGYRHRAQIKIDAKRGKIGFYETHTNQIVDIKECLCLTPGLNRLLQQLRTVFTGRDVPNVTEAHCYENDRGQTAVYFGALLPDKIRKELEKYTVVLDSSDIPLTLSFRDYELPMHPDLFLQVNPKLLKEMVQEVESHYEPSDRIAVELYSGTGFFTLPLSNRFQKIYACEENSKAIRYAQEHFAIPNVEWVCKKAEAFAYPADTSVLIADPPRAGLNQQVIQNLLIHSFGSISYISCDVSSFARDVKLLSSKYALERLTLIDLFPQTYHFEIIAKLGATL